MTCSCRSSTLRAFVRSIAQIHFPEANASSTAWLSRRCLIAREGNLPNTSAAISWPRSFHTSIRNYNQSQEAALLSENDRTEGRPEAAASPQAKPSFTELSPEAIDNLAAEIQAADASRHSRPSSTRMPNGRMAQMGRRERSPYSEAYAKKPRERPMRPVQSRYKSIEDNVEGQPTQKKEDWKIQKAALKEKFPDGWQPRKKLSPDALAGIRALHEQFPEDYTTEVLANKFEVSPEAIRRILRSKWEPSPEEEERRQERWFNRGKQVWSRWAELGKKPPTRWRDEGIERKPYRRRAQYEEEDDGGLSETGNNRLIARSKLAKNLM